MTEDSKTFHLEETTYLNAIEISKNENYSIIEKFRALKILLPKFNPYSFDTVIVNRSSQKSYRLTLYGGPLIEAIEDLKLIAQECIEIDSKAIGITIKEEFEIKALDAEHLENTKTYYLNAIQKWFKKENEYLYKLINNGFESYAGSFSSEDAAKNLIDSAQDFTQISTDFISFGYLGFGLAYAQSYITNYTKDKPNIKEDISANASPLTAALVLKHLGVIDYLNREFHLSNTKSLELLVSLLDSPLRATSIDSSYRDKQKWTDIAKQKAIRELSTHGFSENIETFLKD